MGMFIYDIETFPNIYTFTLVREDGKWLKTFEVSARKNEITGMFKCIDFLIENKHSLVGFNNLNFDYPVLHKIIETRNEFEKQPRGLLIAKKIYKWAQEQIESMRGEFANTVKTEDRYIPQIDLFKIHHFDNKAKSTSLKMLEFNMKSHNIEDLPFPVGHILTEQEMDILVVYNQHDVKETLQFFNHSLEQIRFREQLTEKYQRDFMNHNDGKIGKDYFQMRLQEAGVPLYKMVNGKKTMRQSPRSFIEVKDCLFHYYKFNRPEFIAILEWFRKQRISETKGVFSDIEEHLLGDVAQYAVLTEKRKKFKSKPSVKDIESFKKEHPLGWVEEETLKAMEWLFDEQGNHVLEYPLDEDGNPDILKKPKKVRVNKKSYWGCWKVADTLNIVVDGFRLDYGVGGIHGSLENKIVKSNNTWVIVDQDVSSFYPNMAISNRIYPEHLGEVFCDIYQDVYQQRKNYPKGSAENAMMKLALNSVYGDSNNKYSVFYDPKYTMNITIGGQLTLSMLIDMYLSSGIGFKMVMANTDGITFCVKRKDFDTMNTIAKEWQAIVKLELEQVLYSRMFIKDCNNYISEYYE